MREIQADVLPPSSHESLCLDAVTIRSLSIQFHSVPTDERWTQWLRIYFSSQLQSMICRDDSRNCILSQHLLQLITDFSGQSQTDDNERTVDFQTFEDEMQDAPKSQRPYPKQVHDLHWRKIDSHPNLQIQVEEQTLRGWLLTSTRESAITYSGCIHDTLYCSTPVQLRINAVSVSDGPSTAHCTDFIKVTLSWSETRSYTSDKMTDRCVHAVTLNVFASKSSRHIQFYDLCTSNWRVDCVAIFRVVNIKSSLNWLETSLSYDRRVIFF